MAARLSMATSPFQALIGYSVLGAAAYLGARASRNSHSALPCPQAAAPSSQDPVTPR